MFWYNSSAQTRTPFPPCQPVSMSAEIYVLTKKGSQLHGIALMHACNRQDNKIYQQIIHLAESNLTTNYIHYKPITTAVTSPLGTYVVQVHYLVGSCRQPKACSSLDSRVLSPPLGQSSPLNFLGDLFQNLSPDSS